MWRRDWCTPFIESAWESGDLVPACACAHTHTYTHHPPPHTYTPHTPCPTPQKRGTHIVPFPSQFYGCHRWKRPRNFEQQVGCESHGQLWSFILWAPALLRWSCYTTKIEKYTACSIRISHSCVNLSSINKEKKLSIWVSFSNLCKFGFCNANSELTFQHSVLKQVTWMVWKLLNDLHFGPKCKLLFLWEKITKVIISE